MEFTEAHKGLYVLTSGHFVAMLKYSDRNTSYQLLVRSKDGVVYDELGEFALCWTTPKRCLSSIDFTEWLSSNSAATPAIKSRAVEILKAARYIL